MTEPLSKTPSRAADADAATNASLFSEIRRTAALYWASGERKRLLIKVPVDLLVKARTVGARHTNAAVQRSRTQRDLGLTNHLPEIAAQVTER